MFVEALHVLVVAAVDEGDDPAEELTVGMLGQGRQIVARLTRGESDLVRRFSWRHDSPPSDLPSAP